MPDLLLLLLARPWPAGVSLFTFDPERNDVIKQARTCAAPAVSLVLTLPWSACCVLPGGSQARVLCTPPTPVPHTQAASSQCKHTPCCLPTVARTAAEVRPGLLAVQVVTYRQPSQEEYVLYLVSMKEPGRERASVQQWGHEGPVAQRSLARVPRSSA